MTKSKSETKDTFNKTSEPMVLSGEERYAAFQVGYQALRQRTGFTFNHDANSEKAIVQAAEGQKLRFTIDVILAVVAIPGWEPPVDVVEDVDDGSM